MWRVIEKKIKVEVYMLLDAARQGEGCSHLVIDEPMNNL